MQPGPYAPAAPPASYDQLVRPAKSWFVVAGTVAVVGVIVAIVVFVRGMVSYTNQIENFDRTSVPGSMVVDITSTGGYSIYHEYTGAYENGLYLARPAVTVTNPSGETVNLSSYSSSVTYRSGGHEGVGIYTFDAPEPGSYEVSVSESNSNRSGSTIAVGRGIGSTLVFAIVGSMVIGFVAVLTGGVIAIVVGVKRGRSRRALMPPPAYGGWGAPPAPGWGASGPPGWGTPPPAPPGPPGWGAPPPPPTPPGPAGPAAWGPSPGPPPSGPGPGAVPPGGPGAPPGPRDATVAYPDSDGPTQPTDSWRPPAPGGGASYAVPVSPAATPRGVGAGLAGAGAHGDRAGGAIRPVTDPASLRSPVDWSHGDRPLPWASG
jgi:hypothetical protein